MNMFFFLWEVAVAKFGFAVAFTLVRGQSPCERAAGAAVVGESEELIEVKQRVRQ